MTDIGRIEERLSAVERTIVDGGGEGDGAWLPDLTYPGIETLVKVLTFLALMVFFALLILGKIAILPAEAAALVIVGGVILIAILLQRLILSIAMTVQTLEIARSLGGAQLYRRALRLLSRGSRR